MCLATAEEHWWSRGSWRWNRLTYSVSAARRSHLSSASRHLLPAAASAAPPPTSTILKNPPSLRPGNGRDGDARRRRRRGGGEEFWFAFALVVRRRRGDRRRRRRRRPLDGSEAAGSGCGGGCYSIGGVFRIQPCEVLEIVDWSLLSFFLGYYYLACDF